MSIYGERMHGVCLRKESSLDEWRSWNWDDDDDTWKPIASVWTSQQVWICASNESRDLQPELSVDETSHSLCGAHRQLFNCWRFIVANLGVKNLQKDRGTCTYLPVVSSCVINHMTKARHVCRRHWRAVSETISAILKQWTTQFNPQRHVTNVITSRPRRKLCLLS